MKPVARTLRSTLTILFIWAPLSSCTLNNNPTIFTGGYNNPYAPNLTPNIPLNPSGGDKLLPDPNATLKERYANSGLEKNTDVTKVLPPYIGAPSPVQSVEKAVKGKPKKTKCDPFVLPTLPPVPQPTVDEIDKVDNSDSGAMMNLMSSQIQKAQERSEKIEKLLAEAIAKHLKSCTGG